jgi:tetratricopeptide (TPR) repeat protein
MTKAGYVMPTFNRIHRLMRDRRFRDALSALLRGNFELSPEYWFDPNHAWYCVGDCFFELKEYQKAIKAFKKAYDANSDDVDALIAIGNSWDALGKPSKAAQVFQEALAHNPPPDDYRVITFNLANALIDQKKWDVAVALLIPLADRKDSLGKSALRNLQHIEQNQT